MYRRFTGKYAQNVKRLTEGFKLGALSCEDERGNLVTDAQRTLRLWRHHILKNKIALFLYPPHRMYISFVNTFVTHRNNNLGPYVP